MEGLTHKQKKFADEYLETVNRTKAALEAYDTKDYMTAANIGSENLKKPKIIEYLSDNAELVAANMVKLALTAEKDSDQISAGKDVLDRAGFKPTDKSETTSTLKIIESSKEGINKYKLYDIDQPASADTK